MIIERTTVAMRSLRGCSATKIDIALNHFSDKDLFFLTIIGLGVFSSDSTAGIKNMLAVNANNIPTEARIPNCAAGTIVCVIRQSIPAIVVIPVRSTGSANS